MYIFYTFNAYRYRYESRWFLQVDALAGTRSWDLWWSVGFSSYLCLVADSVPFSLHHRRGPDTHLQGSFFCRSLHAGKPGQESCLGSTWEQWFVRLCSLAGTRTRVRTIDPSQTSHSQEGGLSLSPKLRRPDKGGAVRQACHLCVSTSLGLMRTLIRSSDEDLWNTVHVHPDVLAPQ